MPNDIRITSIKIQIDAAAIVDKTAVHRAMANRYRDIVRANFGFSGIDRPTPWRPLSDRYRNYLSRMGKAKPSDARRGVATLFRTGRLFASIRASSDSQAGHVISDGVPYNIIQQFGGFIRRAFDNKPITIPPRPYFPFYRDGRPTAYAQSEMERVAKEAASR